MKYRYFLAVVVAIVLAVGLIGFDETRERRDTAGTIEHDEPEGMPAEGGLATTSAASSSAPAALPKPAARSTAKPAGTAVVTKPAPDASVTVITYTDAGFKPLVASVPEGKTVRFVNMSSRSLWVASNDHPTHDGYPGFDQGKSVGRGGIYNFTFTRTGSFMYHNHNHPAHQGVVTVMEQ
jgi:plastocyanin